MDDGPVRRQPHGALSDASVAAAPVVVDLPVSGVPVAAVPDTSGAEVEQLLAEDAVASSSFGSSLVSSSSSSPSTPRKALVLNATLEPLCVVPARRAVVLVLAAKADVVSANGHRFRSERIDMAAPSIIRLRAFVRVPYRRRAALSRRGVFIRDEHACQYCGVPAENVDHVLPRSRGGAHEWENVVAACRRCNSRKKDRTPAEASMTLARTPFAPRAAFWLIVAVGGVDPGWDAYLGDALSAS